MATFKRVGATLSHTTDTLLYTAPAKGAILVSVLISHKNSQDAPYGVNFRVRAATGGTETFLLGKDVLIPQKTSLTLTSKIVLQPGETLRAFAPPVDSKITTPSVDINISIMEF